MEVRKLKSYESESRKIRIFRHPEMRILGKSRSLKTSRFKNLEICVFENVRSNNELESWKIIKFRGYEDTRIRRFESLEAQSLGNRYLEGKNLSLRHNVGP